MKSTTIKILGVEVPYEIPVDAAEFDKLAGRVGACCDEGTKNVLYRGTFSDLRDIVLHGADAVKDASGKEVLPAFVGLEESSKLDRKTKKVKNAKGDKELEVYDETEDAFFSRIMATQKKELKDYSAFFATAAKYAPFDPSARERKPAAPKKLAEKFKVVAKDFLEGRKSLEKLNALFTKTLNKSFTKSGNVENDVVALGWLCKEYADAQDVFAKVG